MISRNFNISKLSYYQKYKKFVKTPKNFVKMTENSWNWSTRGVGILFLPILLIYHPGGQFSVKLAITKFIRIGLLTNHLGRNKIPYPLGNYSFPRGFAAWERIISLGVRNFIPTLVIGQESYIHSVTKLVDIHEWPKQFSDSPQLVKSLKATEYLFIQLQSLWTYLSDLNIFLIPHNL